MPNSIKSYFSDTLWHADLSAASTARSLRIRLTRLAYVLYRDLTHGALNLRAMSLVYTTLLSLVPLLAVSFSVLKGFGVHNQIEPLLQELLDPLGSKGDEIGTNIMQFIDNIKVGVLGSLGFALLFYTVISLISKIEDAFNHTWRIDTPRPFMQRFSYYLSTLLVGPVLIFAAMGVTATMMNHSLVQQVAAIEPFGTLIIIGGQLVPYLMTIAAFFFVYIFLPNTAVHFRPALIGATIAGLLWKTAGWFFTAFVASSGEYDAIYSGFAVLIVFMIWLYVSWLIFLIGAQIAYYCQHPEQVRYWKTSNKQSVLFQERLLLSLIHLIGKRFIEGQPALSQEALSHHLEVPQKLLEPTLTLMEKAGFITATAGDVSHYVPARDLANTSLYALLNAVRQIEYAAYSPTSAALTTTTINRTMDAVDRALKESLTNISIQMWISDGLDR
ncbi:MAG: YihY/virulence factor BrkB family protein [Gammaproteobacteria bacterium]|nr:YihY/virulence factor BrkB family protein [Gammaproteobacteria bacterium]